MTFNPSSLPSSIGLQKLGPYHVTYQTANIRNPADNIGALVGPVFQPGTIVLYAWLHTTVSWVAATSIDELIIILGTASQNMLDVAASVATQINGTGYSLVGSGSASGGSPPRYIQSGTDQLGIALYTTGALTAGAGDVYAVTLQV